MRQQPTHLRCFLLGSRVQATELLLGSAQLPSPCIAAQKGLKLLLPAAFWSWRILLSS